MSNVMTVRVAEDLLARIRAAAKSEARSVSSYVLHVLEEHLRQQEARSAPLAKAKKSAMGSLRHLEAPSSIEEFRTARREISRNIERGLQHEARRLERK